MIGPPLPGDMPPANAGELSPATARPTTASLVICGTKFMPRPVMPSDRRSVHLCSTLAHREQCLRAGRYAPIWRKGQRPGTSKSEFRGDFSGSPIQVLGVGRSCPGTFLAGCAGRDPSIHNQPFWGPLPPSLRVCRGGGASCPSRACEKNIADARAGRLRCPYCGENRLELLFDVPGSALPVFVLQGPYRRPAC